MNTNPSNSSNGFSMPVTEDPYSSIDDNFKSEVADPDDFFSSVTNSLQRKNISMYKSNLNLDEAGKEENAVEDPYASIDQVCLRNVRFLIEE